MRRTMTVTLSLSCLLVLSLNACAQQGVGRDVWQQPEKIMDAVGVEPGMIIGEVGAGEGYFTFKLSQRVGEKGKIYANDIDKKALRTLKKRRDREEIRNIETILGEVEDPLFPEQKLDMVIMVLVFHELEKPVIFMENIIPHLSRNATLVIVERDPEKWARNRSHFVTKETVLNTMKKTSYELVRVETFLPRDNIFVYRPNQKM